MIGPDEMEGTHQQKCHRHSRFREVLDCGSPLPLFGAIRANRKKAAEGCRSPKPRGCRSWLAVLTHVLFLVSLSAHAAEWSAAPNFRARALAVPANGKPGFTLMAGTRTGVSFTNVLSLHRQLRSHVLLNGSGLALGDVDGDGWCDIYFCGLDGPNVLYRNLGDWEFEDITAKAGVACADLDAAAAVLADLDGDRDLDLLVSSTGGGTHVFSNDGKGRFESSARLNPNKGGTSLALADIEGDGDLDIYQANYRATMLQDMPQTQFRFGEKNGKKVIATVNGRPVTDPEFADRFAIGPMGAIEELGESHVLYRNLGSNNFVPLSFTNGAFLDEEGRLLAERPLDWGLSVMFRDINGDNLPDIYVCNDFDSPDRIWLNVSTNAVPRFRAIHRLAFRKLSLFSMGVDFADINRDGFDDIFVLDMLSRDHVRRLTQMPDRKPTVPAVGIFNDRPQFTMNTLFLNGGDGTYAEIAQLAGVSASEWSWTAIFLDVDLDGWEDLLVANGHARDARNLDVLDELQAMRAQRKMSSEEILEARRIFPPLAVPNLAFRNRRDLTFEEAGKDWGFDTTTVSHGMALGDLDNDGDLDVVVNNLNDAAGLYRNDTAAPRLPVQLKGRGTNTFGIGARIKVSGGPVTQSQEMMAGGRYLSSDQAIRTFAAGAATNQLAIEVTWRNGGRTIVTNARANHLYEIEERVEGSSARAASTERQKPDTRPMFEDRSDLLSHRHHDDPFNDSERQPHLTRKLSQQGPGISWADVDGDGWDDLIVGDGKGGQMAVYRNDGRGGFKRETHFDQTLTRDQTTILVSGPLLLAGSSNYEDGRSAGTSVRQYDLNAKSFMEPPAFEYRKSTASTGPLALGDIDADGDLDLFVGGRAVAGHYPQAASSSLFRSTGQQFELDAETSKRFAEVGLVNGAVFSDLTADGFPELILACDWGPIRIFRNERGQLTPWDPPVERRGEREKGREGERTSRNADTPVGGPLSLSQFTGWWNGVTTGDFDNDGRLDIIASNWGRNTPYELQRQASHPLLLYHGDLDGDGVHDMIEAYHDPRLNKIVSRRMASFVGAFLPFVGERFQTYEAFARASIQEICGPEFKNARELRATWLDTTLFLNRGDRFEVRSLSVEAQMSPAFAICVCDFDGDGKEDVFLSQNFFALRPGIPRYDAGRGLLMRGRGDGAFTPVAARDSGIEIYGEQRGAAVADYDADGRMDLVVTQNGAETKLYRNASAKPGLRVRLAGPPANPNAIGATLRLVTTNSTSAARELHAGSGYWSQDSAIAVLAAPSSNTSPLRLSVRWPGGKTTDTDIPSGSREIAITDAGELKVLK
jgi:enediyne biosynthesis protein E4